MNPNSPKVLLRTPLKLSLSADKPLSPEVVIASRGNKLFFGDLTRVPHLHDGSIVVQVGYRLGKL